MFRRIRSSSFHIRGLAADLLQACRRKPDQPRNGLLIRNPEMLFSTKKRFNQKVGDELHVDGGIGELHLITFAGVRLVIRPGVHRPQGRRYRLEDMGKMLVTEFNDVNVHQPPEVGVLGDDLPHDHGQARQILRLQAAHQWGNLLLLQRLHLQTIAAHQAGVDLFLGVVVVVDVAQRNTGCVGDLAHAGAVISLAGEDPEGGILNAYLVAFDGLLFELGHGLL